METYCRVTEVMVNVNVMTPAYQGSSLTVDCIDLKRNWRKLCTVKKAMARVLKVKLSTKSQATDYTLVLIIAIYVLHVILETEKHSKFSLLLSALEILLNIFN